MDRTSLFNFARLVHKVRCIIVWFKSFSKRSPVQEVRSICCSLGEDCSPWSRVCVSYSNSTVRVGSLDLEIVVTVSSFLFFSFFFQYTFSLSCACVHSQQQRLYELFFSIGPLQAMGNTILIQLSRLSKLYVSKCSDHQRSLLTVWETLLEDELFWKRSYRIASYYRYNSRYSFFLRRQAYVNIPVIHLNYNCYLDKEGQCNRFNIILVYNLYPRYSAESISFHRCLSDLFIYYGALNSIFTSKGSSWGFLLVDVTCALCSKGTLTSEFTSFVIHTIRKNKIPCWISLLNHSIVSRGDYY